jgi:hypothetical protein
MTRSRRNRDDKFYKPSVTRPLSAVKDDLGGALDALNAWGYLEEWKEGKLKKMTCFGPDVFRGYTPTAWAGVILWSKPRGYYHYDTLYMVGVWAIRAKNEGIDVLVGTKEAAYSQPFYNAEAYNFRIQKEFKTLYQDNGAPPGEDRYLYQTHYEPTKRLEIRQMIEKTLKQWADCYR